MRRSYRYVTVSDAGEETWYDSQYEAEAAAGDELCIVEYTYEEINCEFVQHAEGHESDGCGR